MGDFMADLRNTVQRYNMLTKGDSVVVGVSGGADSLCLLHALKELTEEYELKLYAVHLNHMFRGREAEEDAEFVRQICSDWGITSFIETFNVPEYIKKTGLSPEEAGREIRYRLFEEVRCKVNADKIAVAQNLNDNAETIIMRFLRGTGLDGLKGIDFVRGSIIRPLIEIERSRIDAYCAANNLEPRVDKTNFQAIYSRNKIRLELIPYIMKNFNPNINAAMSRFAGLVRDENEYIELQARKYFDENAVCEENTVRFDKHNLCCCHVAIVRRLVRYAIHRLYGSLTGFEQKHIDAAAELITKGTGAAVELPHAIRAYVSYNELIISKNIEKHYKKCYYSLKYDTTNNVPEQCKIFNIARKSMREVDLSNAGADLAYIDFDKIRSSLVLRNREAGDIFSPIGMKGSKKLKEYFIDEKIPKDMRDNILLIADGSEIVWVVGKRISEKYKVTSTTSEVLEIRVINQGNKTATI
ncbi:MAG: tRNA lysidine(34) synthetase TilS [Bacillota bacterium]